jgi:heterodisulfide reductase subunit C
MTNWGYKISTDNQIDLDKGSFGFMNVLLKTEPSFAACMACGSCAATCPARENGAAFGLLNVNILTARGQTKKLALMLENCMLCGKCGLICPRGVNTRNVIIALKNICKNEI